MLRIYKIQRQGGAYYLCLPTFLVTKEMLEKGVTIELIEYNQDHIIMKVCVANREHDKDSQDSRKDSSQSRSASGVRKTD